MLERIEGCKVFVVRIVRRLNEWEHWGVFCDNCKVFD